MQKALADGYLVMERPLAAVLGDTIRSDQCCNIWRCDAHTLCVVVSVIIAPIHTRHTCAPWWVGVTSVIRDHPRSSEITPIEVTQYKR